jgi:glycosyltransferase involved in cell wall biosynthesis
MLLVSDAGVPSGFGQVAQNIGDRLVDMGWDVHCLAANYRGDYWPTKMKLYPANQIEQKDVYGFSRLVEMLGKVVPDVVVFINDPQVVMRFLLDNKYDAQHVLWAGAEIGDVTYKPPILAYLPVDGYDSPRSWDILSQRVTRIAMTKFGRDTALPEAEVLWHGVDTDLYKPMDKAEAKRMLGYDPDRFLILRVDKNSARKDYPASWKALRPLLQKYPDIDVHFHCLVDSYDGYDLRGVMFNDEDIRDRVNFPPNMTGFSGWSDQTMAVLYAAADLYISTSWGEGFGLGPLQAMACGTPVIAQDCSALTEVVGPGGVLIPPKGRISVPMGQDQCLPDIEAFTREIEHLYLAGGVRRKLAKAAVAQAQRFSWDYTAAGFDRIATESIQQQAPPAEPVAV